MGKKVAVSKISRVKKNTFIPIVAIGASAGGIEPVMELFKKLPVDTGMAFIYIQHLDPTHESMLVPILSKVTKMKVSEAKNMQRVEANQLYIIPPNKAMTLIDGVLKLQQRKPRPNINLPIDQFFISLAEKHKDKAIGIVLSGSSNDGTLGLKAIKMEGGLTFVQDETAKFQSMPRSAIAEGVVDLIMSPAEMAIELERLSKKTDFLHLVISDESDDTVIKDEDFLGILQLLKKSTGVDFTHYKSKTIKRRIVRRMLLFRLDDLKEYNNYLKQHAHEITLLYNDLLINVTNFFRDAAAMDYLKKTLLPRILKSKSASDPIRIWVPACSTGEEAYSIAIILIELLGEKSVNTSIQIFATDLSEIAIAKARLGLYSRNDLQEVSPKRLQRFFTKTDSSYRIVKSIRDLCIFAPHNVFKDPPFSRIDLISCCNLLIYLDVVLQKKVLAIFHYALGANGYLMLGKSETIGSSAQLYTQVDKKYKIYARKKEAASRAMIDMNYQLPEGEKAESLRPGRPLLKEPDKVIDLEKEVDTILLTKYIPSCVVVNHDLEVLQFRGETGLFLEHLPGKASLNLLKMARQGLAFDLRSLTHKAGKSNQRAKKTGLEIKYKGALHLISIEVVPLKPDGNEKLFLVIFDESPLPAAAENIASLSKDKMVKKLQDELGSVREDMHSIVEEQEASNEELQSANEEIVSSNEELQSINEELETSKEEVESANEELMTINQELQMRNEQLVESYEYAEAVFHTIREAILVLDFDLRVKTANRAFYQIFRLKEDEVEGRLIYELDNKQWNIPRLHELLEVIIPKHMQYQGFELRHTFPGIGEKFLLLNASKVSQKIHARQLMLLAIEDITEHKMAELVLAEREAWLRNMADNAPVMIWVAGFNKQATFFNQTWLQYTGRKQEQEAGNGWMDNIHEDDLPAFIQAYNKCFNERNAFRLEFRLRNHDGEYRWLLNMGKPSFTAQGTFSGYIVSCTEIHDKKIMQEDLEKRVAERTHDLQQTNKELERSNSELQQFAYVASHDLQEPLRKIITFAVRLQQEFGKKTPAQGQNYVEKITDSSTRMMRLVDALLNFSRISRSSDTFKKTDLNVTLKVVMNDFETIVSQKKAVINISKLPTLQAIPVQMEQLFHNIISNALKFCGAKRAPKITISSKTLTKKQVEEYPKLNSSVAQYEIIVKDNGIGFDQDFAEQIFVIFQRLNDDKLEYPGTGIGLALCRKIINNHGGEIFATSKKGKGAEFHIILPEKQA